MAKIVHARLDEKSTEVLGQLTRLLGCTESKIIREALMLLNATTLRNGKRRIIGFGKFQSGTTDLGSNKARLKGFGR